MLYSRQGERERAEGEGVEGHLEGREEGKLRRGRSSIHRFLEARGRTVKVRHLYEHPRIVEREGALIYEESLRTCSRPLLTFSSTEERTASASRLPHPLSSALPFMSPL